MKACDFCGCKVNDSVRSCPSCGSTDFRHVCPNCSQLFDGSYCASCGVRYDAEPKVCPKCGTKCFTRFCTHCGYDPEKEQTSGSYSPQISQSSSNRAGGGNNTVIALVCGALGIATCMFPFSIMAIGIAAKEEKDGNGSKFTTMAKVLGIIGLVILFMFIAISIASSFSK